MKTCKKVSGFPRVARWAMAFSLLSGISRADLPNWTKWKLDNRPEVPTQRSCDESDVKTLADKRLKKKTSFDAEHRVAKQILDGNMPEKGEWVEVFSSVDERLAFCSFQTGEEEKWTMAVYSLFDTPTPYFLTGENGVAFKGDNLLSQAQEKAKALAFISNPNAHVAGVSVLLEDDAVRIFNDDGIIKAPFDKFYFFTADDCPGANWAHSCRYLFISESGKEFAVLYERLPPYILNRATEDEIPLRRFVPQLQEESFSLDAVTTAVYSAASKMGQKSIAYSSGDVSHSHFVLICGGATPASNGIRFWADTAMFYSTLTQKYHVPDNQIHVFMSDGTSSGNDANLAATEPGVTPVLVSSPLDLDGNGVNDVDGPATKTAISGKFASLRQSLTASDQLVVFITSHGNAVGTEGVNNKNCKASLFASSGASPSFTDQELRNWTSGFKCPVAFAIETCFSGGFIDDITADNNRVIATACNHYEESKGWPGGNKWWYYTGQTFAFNDWAMPLTAAFRGFIPKSACAIYYGSFSSSGSVQPNSSYYYSYPWSDGPSVDADNNDDGKISFSEAAAYAAANDLSRNVEHPQISASPSSLASSFFLLKPPPTPELAFYQPSGWPAPVFVTMGERGTKSVTSFKLGQPVYLNFAYSNVGNANAVRHYVRVDLYNSSSSLVEAWNVWANSGLQPDSPAYLNTGNDFEEYLSPGTYRVVVTLDNGHAVSELDENNNTYTIWFTVTSTPFTSSPVYRFYSRNFKGHFYTSSETEKNRLITSDPNWRYETVAYKAYAAQARGTVPLYRFYSRNFKGHFYTTSETEKNNLISSDPNWRYEIIAYYVYPSAVSGARPVYRFWSAKFKHHFYTMSESEMWKIRNTDKNWKYEKIAFYALPNSSSSSFSAASRGTGAREASAVSAGALDSKDIAVTPGIRLETRPFGLQVEAGETLDLGGLMLEARAEEPDDFAVGTPAPLGDAAPGLRLSLPGGALSPALWSAADGTLVEGDAGKNTFDFKLPASDVWHRLFIRDDADHEVWSLWLRALTGK